MVINWCKFWKFYPWCALTSMEFEDGTSRKSSGMVGIWFATGYGNCLMILMQSLVGIWPWTICECQMAPIGLKLIVQTMILVEVLFLDDRFMLTRFGVTSMKRNWWCKDPTFPRYMLPILELTMEVRMFLHLNLGSHAVSELNVPKPSKTWFSDVFWWFLQVAARPLFVASQGVKSHAAFVTMR